MVACEYCIDIIKFHNIDERTFTQKVEGSTLTGGTSPNAFFQSNRPGHPHPVISEL